MNALLEQYSAMTEEFKLPTMEMAPLSVTTTVLSTAAEVWHAIQQFKPVQGWIIFQSDVLLFTSESELTQQGTVLNAEISGTNSKSLHVRQIENGQWVVVIFAEDGIDNYYMQTRSMLSTEGDDSPYQLKYRVYWKDEEHEVVAKYYRFCGISEGVI